jgi:hypothetical protein
MANELRGVPVFRAGTHVPGNSGVPMKWTVDDLVQIVRNTSLNPRRVPLKLGHSDKQILNQTDGQPALGKVVNPRVEGERILVDFTDVPDAIHSAIKAGLYSDVSVELDFNEQIGWFLSAVAILGADVPAVTNLGELQAYLSAHKPGGNPADGDTPAMLMFSLSAPIVKGKNPMDEKELQAQRDALAKQQAELAEQQRVFAFTSAVSTRKMSLEEKVNAGQMTPAIRDKIVSVWEQRKATFKAGDSLDIPSEVLDDIVKMSATLPKGETAKNGEEGEVSQQKETADALVAREAEVLMAKNQGMRYEDAVRVVFAVKPELKTAYHNILRVNAGMAEVKHG